MTKKGIRNSGASYVAELKIECLTRGMELTMGKSVVIEINQLFRGDIFPVSTI